MKKLQGFASFTSERKREIGSMGGKRAHELCGLSDKKAGFAR